MVSEILNESFKIIKQYFGKEPPKIKSIIRGNKFVAVQLVDMSIGLSFIEREWPHNFPLTFRDNRVEENHETYILAKLACVGLNMEISYGIAILNALTSSIFLHSDRYEYLENVELLEFWKENLYPGKKVGMVGNMYPLVDVLLERGCEVTILDKHALDSNKKPLPKEVQLISNSSNLEEVEILIMTGSSLVYHSTEELIKNSRNASLRAIIGPTVTLPPEPFWKRGVQYIGGAIVDTKFLKIMLTEEVNNFNNLLDQKRKKIALKFGKDSGLKKIGLIKNKTKD